MLRIDSSEFFLLREEEQDRMIDAFSGVFKNLNIGQKISLIRLDRPVFLDERIKELKASSAKRMRSSTKGDRAAAYIRAERLKNLAAVNTNENCFYYNAFYVVLYGYNRAAVDKTLLADVRDLRANNLQATRIGGAELLGFARRTLRSAFDERESAKIAGTKAQQEFVSPEAVTFNSKFAEVDGIAENTFVITRYPTQTFNAWARALCDMGVCAVFVHRRESLRQEKAAGGAACGEHGLFVLRSRKQPRMPSVVRGYAGTPRDLQRHGGAQYPSSDGVRRGGTG